jgi:hypothetical protein
MVSVLGTDVITSTMVLASTYFLVSGIRGDNNFKHKAQLVFAGLFFGLGFTMRLAILFYFPVFIIGLITLRSIKNIQKVKVFSLFMLGIATGIGIVIMGYSFSIGKLPHRPLGHNDSYPILAGTNIDHLGQYNMDDVDLYFSWPDLDRDARAKQEVLRRVISDPIRLLSIFPQKIKIIYGSNDYATTYSLEALDWGLENMWGVHATNTAEDWSKYHNQKYGWITTNAYFSQVIYCIIWFFAFYAFITKKITPIALITLGILSFNIIPYFIIEAHARYHHIVLPFITLIAAESLGKSTITKPKNP